MTKLKRMARHDGAVFLTLWGILLTWLLLS